jgi:hypothetical protein
MSRLSACLPRWIPVILVGLLCSAGVSAQEPTSLAVIAISGQGMWGPDLDRIETHLREELRALGTLELQRKDATAEHVAEARGLGIDCQQRDLECASKIGVLAGVDRVLMLTAAPKEGQFYVTLLVVDVAAGNELMRVAHWVPTAGDEYKKAIESATVRLFAPERYTGALKVRLTPPRARLFVDGELREPEKGIVEGLEPGNRKVRVELEGYRPYEGGVQVRYQEKTDFVVALEPGDEDAPATTTPAGDEATPSAALDPDDGEGPPAATPAPGVEAPALSPLILAGGGALAAGVVVAAIGGGVALFADDRVVNETDLQARKDWQGVGIGGLVGFGGGLLVALVGGGLLGAGFVMGGE